MVIVVLESVVLSHAVRCGAVRSGLGVVVDGGGVG